MASDRAPTSVQSAARWSLASGIVHQFGMVAVSFALASILGPERFGVVALASLYLILIDFLVKQGIGQAIVQRDQLTASHLDSAFIMIMSTAALFAVLTYGLAPLVESAFDAPGLSPLLRALSGVVLLRGIWQVPGALLDRDLKIRERTIALNAAVAAGGIVGVIAAFRGAEETALAYQSYTQSVVAVILIPRVAKWRPTSRASLRSARELASFSVGALLASLGAFASQRSDTILIGLFFGPLAVGFYRFASRLVQLTLHLTAGAVGRVGLAALSRSQHDPETFGSQALRLLREGSALSAPLLALLFASARISMEFFGEEWGPAVPVARILALAGIARVIVIYATPIQQARGQAHRAAAVLWVTSAIAIAAVAGYGALATGSAEDLVTGVAWVRFLVQVVVVAPALVVVIAAAASISAAEILRAVLPAMTASAVILVVGGAVDLVLEQSGLSLIVQALVLGCVLGLVSVPSILAVSAESRALLAQLPGGSKLLAINPQRISARYSDR